MKNVNQIRHLLTEVLDNFPQANYIEDCKSMRLLEEALALLPCERCNGSGHKPRPRNKEICDVKNGVCVDLSRICECCGHFIPPAPCPDCQEKPEDMLTVDYMECWLIHPKDDVDCDMCLNIGTCRFLRKYWRPDSSQKNLIDK